MENIVEQIRNLTDQELWNKIQELNRKTMVAPPAHRHLVMQTLYLYTNEWERRKEE